MSFYRSYGSDHGGYGYNSDQLASVYDYLPAPESLWSVARRLRRAYTGPVIRVRRSSDNVEQDFYGSGASGLVSPEAIRSFNGWNLVSHSNAFLEGTWARVNLLSVTDNSATTPAGNAAALVIPNTTLVQHRIERSTTTAVAGLSHCWSFVAKAAGYGFLWVRLGNAAGCVANLSTGALTGVTGTCRSTSLGDGWWMIEVVGVAAGSDAARINIIPSASISDYSGDGASGAYIAAPQLEVGTARSTYEPRTTTGAGSSFLVTRYDQSGNARHATQATTTLQPIVCESGVPVVNSGGRLTSKHVAADARRLAVASSTGIYNFLHTTGGTVLAVATANDTAAAKLILSSASSSTGAGIRISRGSNEVYGVATGRLDVAGVATAGNSIAVNHAGSASTSNTILISQVDPDNGTAASRALSWGNGTALSTTNAEAGTPFVENASDNMTIGATAAGGSAFDGTIGDVGIWSVFFTEAERKLVEADQGRFNSITVAP